MAAGPAPASLALSPGQPSAAAAQGLSVRQSPQAILVTSGELSWSIPTAGEALIATATRAGRITLRDMKLVALWQDKAELADNDALRQQRFTSKIAKATVGTAAETPKSGYTPVAAVACSLENPEACEACQ